MFIRFCSSAIDRESGQPRGVFMEAKKLLNSARLSAQERMHLCAMLNWFSEHIPAPPKEIQQSAAVFWFKSAAQENMSHLDRLIRLLRRHGLFIVAHQAESLDHIVYEDEYQVAVDTTSASPEASAHG